MRDARTELLQRMALFGGVRADILQFLLAFCPVVTVLRNDFFFHQGEEGDALFVLESGEAAVLKSWGGQNCWFKPSRRAIASERWR